MAAEPLPFPDDGELAASKGLPALVNEATAASDPVSRLLAVNAELKSLAAIDWAAHVDANAKEAVQGLEQIFRSTTAIQVSILGAAETSGKWALDGQRTFDSWVSSQTGTTRGTAGRAVKLSKTLQDDLPATRKALAEGSISSDHAQIIARRCTKTDKHRKRLTDPRQGETFLIDNAKQMDAGKFAKVANAWAIESDPKAAERQWRQESAKEEVILAPVEDGYHLAGWLNSVNGALLQEALSAHMGRKAADDLRPINERRVDGLISLASQSLDSGLKMPNARIRPHLTLTMEYDTIERLVAASGPLAPQSAQGGEGTGQFDEDLWAQQWRPGDDHVISTELDYSKLEGVTPATLPDGTPIPHGVLAKIACDSMLTRVVFGAESTVLDAGREERIFPAHQVRAIIARDRTCRYPGCDEGPGFGEIHHSLSWAKHNGTTHVDLGILLCYFHHGLVHERDIAITRRRGEWVFTTRHGKVIHPPGHRPPGDADPFNVLAAPGSDSEIANNGEARGDPGRLSSTSAQEQTSQWEQPGFYSSGPPPF